MEHLTDTQLVASYLKKSDEQALEELVRRYLPAVYGFCRNYTGSPEQAADIAQETFVKVWKYLDNFDQAQSFRGWLFTIAKRTAIDWLRKAQDVPFSAISESEQERWAAPPPERPLDLSLALARLPADQRFVLRRHLEDGFLFREIAGQLQESLNTVKSRYRRGLLTLKNILERDR